MSKADGGQLIAGVALLLIVVGLALWRRPIWVAKANLRYTASGASKTVAQGARIPEQDVDTVAPDQMLATTKSALSGIIIGKDGRVSTSKTVAFAWTLLVLFGLLSFIAARILGDPAGWDALVDKSLQEEYLLLLGGPYAAAILAKYKAVTQSQGEGKTPAQPDQAKAGQLVADDEGDTDLGDFQYVVFNLVGLIWVLSDFIGNAEKGLPDLPPLLAGLTLTAAAGYSGKKLIQQARPTLVSVVPHEAQPGADISVYGTNLTIPKDVVAEGSDIKPLVTVGGRPAPVTTHDVLLGTERLTLKVPTGAAEGGATLSVVRADGVPAVGPAGSDGIPFRVLKP